MDLIGYLNFIGFASYWFGLASLGLDWLLITGLDWLLKFYKIRFSYCFARFGLASLRFASLGLLIALFWCLGFASLRFASYYWFRFLVCLCFFRIINRFFVRLINLFFFVRLVLRPPAYTCALAPS